MNGEVQGGSSPEISKEINFSYETHFLVSWKSMANMCRL